MRSFGSGSRTEGAGGEGDAGGPPSARGGAGSGRGGHGEFPDSATAHADGVRRQSAGSRGGCEADGRLYLSEDVSSTLLSPHEGRSPPTLSLAVGRSAGDRHAGRLSLDAVRQDSGNGASGLAGSSQPFDRFTPATARGAGSRPGASSPAAGRASPVRTIAGLKAAALFVASTGDLDSRGSGDGRGSPCRSGRLRLQSSFGGGESDSDDESRYKRRPARSPERGQGRRGPGPPEGGPRSPLRGGVRRYL